MGMKVYGKEYRTVSLILQREEKATNYDESVAFATNIGDKKLEQDVLTRYKRAMRDIFTFNGKKQYKDFSDIKELIKKHGNESDIIRIFNRIAQEFQHSDYYDYVSNNVRANIYGKYWIIVNTKNRTIEILDCANQFKNILEEEASNVKKVKKIPESATKKILKKLGEQVLEEGHNYYEGIPEEHGHVFKYGENTFLPVLKVIIKNEDKRFAYMSRHFISDKKYENYTKNNWNYNEFIKKDEAVNKESKTDIYLCLENGKFYCPANNELFVYEDGAIKLN